MFFKPLGASSIFALHLIIGVILAPHLAYASDFQNSKNRKPLHSKIIAIKILNEDELSGVYTINEHNEMTLPLIGTVQIENNDPQKIAAQLTKKYANGYLINPIITTHFMDKNASPNKTGNNIYILGGVKNPGRYTLPADANHILHIIAMAGGHTGRAKAKIYKILRKNQEIAFNAETYTPRAGDIITVKERIFWAGNQ